MTRNELRTLEELLGKAAETGYFDFHSEVWEMVKDTPQDAIKWFLGYLSVDTGSYLESDEEEA